MREDERKRDRRGRRWGWGIMRKRGKKGMEEVCTTTSDNDAWNG